MNKREAEKKLLQILKDGDVTIRPAQLTELYKLVDKLVEKPGPVEVSEAEADMLELAKSDLVRAPGTIKDYADTHHGWAMDNVLEDRLMRAYVNGYTVKKPKRWNVRVPHTKEVWYYKSGDADLLTICPADKKLRGMFTDAEIIKYGLQDCERVEVIYR